MQDKTYRLNVTVRIGMNEIRLIERDAKKAGLSRSGFLTGLVENHYKEEIEKKHKRNNIS